VVAFERDFMVSVREFGAMQHAHKLFFHKLLPPLVFLYMLSISNKKAEEPLTPLADTDSWSKFPSLCPYKYDDSSICYHIDGVFWVHCHLSVYE
jgi:hypothetical protein